MDHATRDCLITGYESPVSVVALPDIHDRHILAAAVMGRCDVIASQNLKHFPVRKVRARLKNPPYNVADYLNTLARQGLVATAAELEQFAELL